MTLFDRHYIVRGCVQPNKCVRCLLSISRSKCKLGDPRVPKYRPPLCRSAHANADIATCTSNVEGIYAGFDPVAECTATSAVLRSSFSSKTESGDNSREDS